MERLPKIVVCRLISEDFLLQGLYRGLGGRGGCLL